MSDDDNDDDDDDGNESEVDIDSEYSNDDGLSRKYSKNNLNKVENNDDGYDNVDSDDDDDYDNSDEEVEEVHTVFQRSSNSSTSKSDTTIKDKHTKSRPIESIPLFERLQRQAEEEESLAIGNNGVQDGYRNRHRKRLKSEQGDGDSDKVSLKRVNKNAPAVMRSDRPVRRLRVTGNNAVKKPLDPRFTDYSGTLKERIFSKNYSFLDDYREDEINILSKAMKTIKDDDAKGEIRSELLKMKQQAKEIKLNRKVTERLEQMRSVEKDKLRQGKKPFYLKRSVVQTIGLEER